MRKKKKNSLLITWSITLAIALLVICCMPYILTRQGIVDFSETGQIGDTIGGIMGPLIAIVASILTFIAFWVQYQANLAQREDIALERIENRFYSMLGIYSQMASEIMVNDKKGKDAFVELAGEFSIIYYTLINIYERIKKDGLTEKNQSAKQYIDTLEKSGYEKYLFFTQLAFNLFFYGVRYEVVDFTPGKTALVHELIECFQQIQRFRDPISFTDYAKGSYTESLYDIGVKGPVMSGHSEFLGHYYRHMFQIVKYIASIDEEIVPEEQKYAYIKVLRAQLSDYEQVLLFYNSLTTQGSAWNSPSGNYVGYIERFKLIKNIPPNFALFGITPMTKYKETLSIESNFFSERALAISKESYIETNNN